MREANKTVVSEPLSQSDVKSSKTRLVKGVDMMRFFAACWVFFSHGGSFPLGSVTQELPKFLSWPFNAIDRWAYNGSAAVVVFFIISGFCIHYPNVTKSSLGWKQFIAKRGARILIPLGVAVGLARILGHDFIVSENAVLWSIYCEIAYYCLYPLVFIAVKKLGIEPILLLTSGISIIIAILNTEVHFLFQLGLVLTAIAALPFWIAGLHLATHFETLRLVKVGSLWVWRAGFVICCAVITILLFNLPGRFVSQLWSLPLFAIFACFWIVQELGQFRTNAFTNVLERLGTASYSIYLIHKLSLTAAQKYLPEMDTVLNWAVMLTITVVGCVIFYFIVEKPSHHLSRGLKFAG